MSKKKKDWKVEKARLLDLSLEERRKDYRGNHVPLEKIPTWTRHDKSKGKEGKEEGEEPKAVPVLLSDKVSLYKGDITILEVDAIVNAAISAEQFGLRDPTKESFLFVPRRYSRPKRRAPLKDRP